MRREKARTVDLLATSRVHLLTMQTSAAAACTSGRIALKVAAQWLPRQPSRTGAFARWLSAEACDANLIMIVRGPVQKQVEKNTFCHFEGTLWTEKVVA